MENYPISFGTQGFSSPYSVQNQLNGSNVNNQLSADEGTLNKYDNLLLWQAGSQQAIDESVYIEMQAYEDIQGTDEWELKYEEVTQKYYEIAGETAYSFVEDGEEYADALEALTQDHMEAYDIIEKDGNVTFEEYKANELLEYNTYLPAGDTPATEEDELITQMLKNSFDFMDLNGDNTLNADEIKAYYLLADMYDATANPPENPADAMDGNIKFSTIDKFGDIIAAYAPEDSDIAEEQSQLKAALIEAYNTIAAIPIVTLPPMPECGEPTARGKMFMAIEKSILNNPFENKG